MAGRGPRGSRRHNTTSQRGDITSPRNGRDPTTQHSVEGTAPSHDIYQTSRGASRTEILEQQTATEKGSQESSNVGESGNILCQIAFVNALT